MGRGGVAITAPMTFFLQISTTHQNLKNVWFSAETKTKCFFFFFYYSEGGEFSLLTPPPALIRPYFLLFMDHWKKKHGEVLHNYFRNYTINQHSELHD